MFNMQLISLWQNLLKLPGKNIFFLKVAKIIAFFIIQLMPKHVKSSKKWNAAKKNMILTSAQYMQSRQLQGKTMGAKLIG